MILILYYAYLGQSWNILGGYAGQLSLGHAAFFGVGAYTSTILFLQYGITPWLGMFVGGCLALIIGLGLGFLTFKYGLRGAYFSLVTLAFAEILRLVATNWDWLGGAVGFLIPARENPSVFLSLNKYFYYYLILVMLILVSVVTWRIQNSKLGIYLTSIREDEVAAESLGIDSFKYKLIATGISAFFTAMAGTFYAQYLLYIDPSIVFDTSLSIEIILRPIIGGSGTVIGPILGAFILGPLSEFTRAYLGNISGLHLMVYGAILMLVIKYMPHGVAGIISKKISK